ncbi:hypothetical protein EDB89DRAFT_2236498 [Lactarius sanguifluus]|nr:hypothetical protein EDB89DRAFT_2236498 [Lactarius sanguifluus]
MALAHEESNSLATIKILPDDVFREIFTFCLPDPYAHGDPIARMRVWQRLVHVCQRWRQIIYASPLYLDLHLYCSHRTPFRKNISRWPEFPLTVKYRVPEDQDDLIAALERPDRVRRVDLIITCSEVVQVEEAMQVPFPALTHLELIGPEDEVDEDVLDLPNRFLGLPTLLLSACDLVSLQLDYVPPASYSYGYIPPEAMVSGLAVLTNLRTLRIRKYASSIPPHKQGRRRPDSPMLAVLPALTEFVFGYDFEYLEDLVAQIDAPRVEDIRIEYLMEGVQSHQLSQFIGCSNLKLAQFRRAQVTFDFENAYIEFNPPQGGCLQAHLSLTISDPVPESMLVKSPVPYVVHVLGQLVAMTSNVGHLSIRQSQAGEDFWESTQWLPLLQLFATVEVLEETVTLPALQLLWLDDDNPERFLSLCQLSGRPVTVVNTQDEFTERLNAHWRCEEKVP